MRSRFATHRHIPKKFCTKNRIFWENFQLWKKLFGENVFKRIKWTDRCRVKKSNSGKPAPYVKLKVRGCFSGIICHFRTNPWNYKYNVQVGTFLKTRTILALLRIHDILGWIRIRILDPDPAIFVIDLQDASKKLFLNTIFSVYYFLKLHLHHFSKIKIKKSENSRYQGFSYYFCMMIEGSGSGSKAGSGSGRPKICGSGSGSGSATLHFGLGDPDTDL